MNKFLNAFSTVYELVALKFRAARDMSRKDNPDQERRLANAMMAWSVLLMAFIVILLIGGWSIVFD